jgi:signal transduction histidine kinase
LARVDVDSMQEKVDQLQREVEELRAARERLVLAADADRQTIERRLHDGPVQQLVALAVNLQLASRLVETDPPGARALVEQIERDVQQALDEAAQLSDWIYPPLLDASGLAPALRSAAVTAGIDATVDVASGTPCPPEAARTVYLLWLHALEHSGAEARPSVTVRHDAERVTFELAGTEPGEALERLRDRIEALGGMLSVAPVRGDPRVAGSLPLRD